MGSNPTPDKDFFIYFPNKSLALLELELVQLNLVFEYFDKSLFKNLEFHRFCWKIFKDFVSLIILDLWIFVKILIHEFTFLAELSNSLLSFKCFSFNLTQKKCFKVFTKEKYALLTSLAHYTVYRFAYFYNTFQVTLQHLVP